MNERILFSLYSKVCHVLLFISVKNEKKAINTKFEKMKKNKEIILKNLYL